MHKHVTRTTTHRNSKALYEQDKTRREKPTKTTAKGGQSVAGKTKCRRADWVVVRGSFLPRDVWSRSSEVWTREESRWEELVRLEKQTVEIGYIQTEADEDEEGSPLSKAWRVEQRDGCHHMHQKSLNPSRWIWLPRKNSLWCGSSLIQRKKQQQCGIAAGGWDQWALQVWVYQHHRSALRGSWSMCRREGRVLLLVPVQQAKISADWAGDWAGPRAVLHQAALSTVTSKTDTQRNKSLAHKETFSLLPSRDTGSKTQRGKLYNHEARWSALSWVSSLCATWKRFTIRLLFTAHFRLAFRHQLALCELAQGISVDRTTRKTARFTSIVCDAQQMRGADAGKTGV